MRPSIFSSPNHIGNSNSEIQTISILLYLYFHLDEFLFERAIFTWSKYHTLSMNYGQIYECCWKSMRRYFIFNSTLTPNKYASNLKSSSAYIADIVVSFKNIVPRFFNNRIRMLLEARRSSVSTHFPVSSGTIPASLLASRWNCRRRTAKVVDSGRKRGRKAES